MNGHTGSGLIARAMVAGVGFSLGFLSVSRAEKPIDFNSDIRPILSDKCFFCHGPDGENREADLRLDVRDAALEAGAIRPGSPEDSTLLDRIAHEDPDELMPPPKAKLGRLSERERDLLRRWIAEGAEYAEHWSFVSIPKTVPVPESEEDDAEKWIRNGIDAFVLEGLRSKSVKPAAEAPRERWLRRVTFDLTGLPPTIEEIDGFLADDSENAFEKVIDRLFESDRYGERMASDWLDLARYADTFGYQADRLTHVWPWRDWVIQAFNDNLPYDDFITWQTAGDLLPDPTRDQILATAFNRLHRQTNEGGSINEEFRIEYVNDRVVTNGTAFLGLTLECSRCHDHKYDPISMRDYYSLSAFFNSIDESGLYSHFTETAPTPVMLMFEEEQEQDHRLAKESVAAAEKKIEVIGGDFGEGEASAPESVEIPERAESSPVFDESKPTGDNQRVEGKVGTGILFSGDDPLTFGDQNTADFSRTDEFSFSLWLKPAGFKSRMVVFHRSKAAEDAAFRGYELMLYDGKPTFSLIHFWPGNAVRVQAKNPLPLNEWTHLAITYDGSSKAGGVRIYRNGKPESLAVIRDNLYKDITHRKEWGDSSVGQIKLQLAGRFRDIGFGGGIIDELEIFDLELTPLEVQRLAFPDTENRIEPSEDDLNRHHLLRESKRYAEARAELKKARKMENDAITPVRQIMVMRDLPEQRPAYLLYRGDYQQRRDEVGPGAPESILSFSDEFPRNRLGFARWLTDDRNPLVARVTVNRFWSLFFGRGLVGTPEDFGSQGERPTHPELLDWLARDFIDSGWDVRKLLKKIALSATYRQDSIPADSATWSDDPENRWLARGPRYRLPAEQIRDNALAVSGLLVEKLGGPSVKPYELAASFKKQSPDKGDGLYRRSLYTFWKRTAPPPVMVTFDATAREVCTAKRESTATPLQALVLLNGPQYVEAARVLAERLLRTGDSLDERVALGFRLCTSRAADAKEMDVLRQVYDEQREHFRANPEEAKALLKTGSKGADASLDPVELAAMVAVCQIFLNFDECYTKR